MLKHSPFNINHSSENLTSHCKNPREVLLTVALKIVPGIMKIKLTQKNCFRLTKQDLTVEFHSV